VQLGLEKFADGYMPKACQSTCNDYERYAKGSRDFKNRIQFVSL